MAPESVTVLPDPLASTPPDPAPPLMVAPNVLAVVITPPAVAMSAKAAPLIVNVLGPLSAIVEPALCAQAP